MSTQALAGALADDRRRQVFAALTLGDGDVPTVATRTGLSVRDVATAVRRLVDAGLVTDTGSGLRVDGERLRELARAGGPSAAPLAASPREAILRTFLRDGTLTRLPAQRGRRRVLLEHITERSFEPGVRYPERAVDDALRAWLTTTGNWPRPAPCTPATATSRSRPTTTTGTPSTGSRRRCGQS